VVGRFLLIERSSKYSGRAAGPSARQQNCNGLLRCSPAICTCSIRLMPGISQRRFHSTIRGPAAEALELLSAHSEEILLIWRERLREMGLDLAQLVPEGIDFVVLSRRLYDSPYPEFRQAVQRFGKTLAARCDRLELVIGAFNRLFETCLPFLIGGAPQRASPILALARLHALVSLLIVSGHTGQWAAGKKTLVEASLAENEERGRRVSTYITRIYEQERRRIAQDLHDEVGHDLILVKLYLEMIVLEKEADAAKQPRLADAIALVSHAIDAVRRMGLDLGPAVFEDLGFLPAVRSYVSQFSSRTKVQVTLREGYVPEEIPMTHQVALYRLMQGALSNVLKHASATRVTISLGSMKDAVLTMVIEDDGVGFDLAKAAQSRSFGLAAMQDRVEGLGGRIHIEARRAVGSSSVHGTRIEVDLPLPGGGES
jgi:signal transduction histidine kinase